MMNGPEKSDPVILAMKPANKAEPIVERSAGEPHAAEPVERRAGTKGNADQQSTRRTQRRESVSQALERIRKVARERKKERFTALLHHINIDLLEEAFFELKVNAAPGVDRLTWKDYETDLESNLKDLHGRVHRGAYRALPSRRVYIPKPDGRQRPLAVAALEDKIVQRAVAALLNAIYEEDFLGFSYGFRPGRGAHDAMDALCVGTHSKKVSFILDADIRSFRRGGFPIAYSILYADGVRSILETDHKVVPALSRLAILFNAADKQVNPERDAAQAVAQAAGINVTGCGIRPGEDFSPAIEALRGNADALYVCLDPFVIINAARINALALAARLPVMHGYRDNTLAEGLISYGPDFPDMSRRAADIVDKILRGAKPVDIPVEQPTKFDLVINLKTASALGIDVAPTLLGRADEVIE